MFKIFRKPKTESVLPITIEKIGQWSEGRNDQLRITLTELDEAKTVLAVFRDGTALRGQITAEEFKHGGHLSKVHYEAGSLGAMTVFAQVDDVLRAKHMNVTSFFYTEPYLPK